MITITFDHADLDYKLQRLANAARVDLGKVIRQEGGNVAMSIMMILPPSTSKAGTVEKPKSSGLAKAAQRQGNNAIKSDLFGGRRKSGARYSSVGLFQRIGSSNLRPPKRARSETASVNLGWERSKTIRIYYKFWRENASNDEMRKFHLRYRDRYGRVPFVSRSAIGRWQVQDQMWISNSSADSYLKSVQEKVGWSKAGFAAAAIACGQRVPAWIRRHAQRAGIASVNFGSNPFVIGTSVATKIPDVGRYIQAGLNFRVKITQMKIDRILANQAVNLGFGRIDGAGRVQENMPR
jgi:hypothetical protein